MNLSPSDFCNRLFKISIRDGSSFNRDKEDSDEKYN